MTRSAASHTPLIPLQKANPCSSASLRACSANRRVSADSPRSAVAGGQEGQGVHPVERLADGVGQVDGVPQMGETPVEMAEHQVTPAGEDVGRHSLVGAEPVPEHQVASGR